MLILGFRLVNFLQILGREESFLGNSFSLHLMHLCFGLLSQCYEDITNLFIEFNSQDSNTNIMYKDRLRSKNIETI